MKRKLSATTKEPLPDKRYGCQESHHWYFCRECRAKVRYNHKCDGDLYQMPGYVQIPRKTANERQWRLFIYRFCQQFRLVPEGQRTVWS